MDKIFLRGWCRIVALVLVLTVAQPALSQPLSPLEQVLPEAVASGATACRSQLAAAGCTGEQAVARELDRDMAAFIVLAERALALRAETIRQGQRLKERLDQDKPLTGDDLDLLNRGLAAHLELRKELFAVAESRECWLDLNEYELHHYGITPGLHRRGVMISLAAALVLYDNYLLAVSLFEGDGKLRRLLNEQDSGYALNRSELTHITMSYNSAHNRQRVSRAIRYYAGSNRALGRPRGEGDAYLALLIDQSPSYSMVRRWSPFFAVGRHFGFMGAVTSDALASFNRQGVTLFSMMFGNAVGLVETRKGKLFGRDEVRDELARTLAAGDILLEKTPFRLTDKLIPGYWGHAAVWIGSEAELRHLGIWDHPVVSRFHGRIREGQVVVEALRSGVEMNSLERFLNIDSIGILRQPGRSSEERAGTIIQALRQVGKPYDFNFDVESRERVYCSKLIYLTYGTIDWTTKKSLGRSTFTPDDVAWAAARGGALELVTLYHDGKRVDERPLERMVALMAAE